MSYVKTAWIDDSPPAVSAANLNKMEQGIYDAHVTADGAIQKPGSANDADVLTYDVATARWIASAPASASSDLYRASTLTSVTVSTDTDLVTLGSQTFLNVPYWLQFYCPQVELNSAALTTAVATLYQDGSPLMEMARITNPSATNAMRVPMHALVKVVPTAGAHTFKVVGSQATGTPIFKGGAGTGGGFAPIALRCWKA